MKIISYLCSVNEDVTATAGCGSAKAKQAALRVLLTPQLAMSKRVGFFTAAEVRDALNSQHKN